MPDLSAIKTTIAPELKLFETEFKSIMRSRIPLLNIVTNYIIRRKGKQIRPMFVFLTAKLLGNVTPATYIAAALIEILHTATLIHDDVVDDTHERRGFLSINAIWKSKIAVLVGDYLLSRGLLLAINNKQYELLDIVSSAVKEMSEGELLQIQKSRKLNLTEEQYYEIIRKKTAALIASCTACGAKSVSVSEETVNRMWKFGEYIGMAFQIKDDLLDYHDRNIIGKPTGNDIKEKKLTLPLIYGLSHNNKADSKRILKLISNNHKNSKKIKEVIEFVRRNGGIEYSQNKMSEYRNKALEIIADYPDSNIKKSLIDLVNFTTTRTA
jgi:octaprenyl-diphosphate synthase